jgi:hypothetical protein
VFDRYYYLVKSFHLGLALADVEMTQHCIAEHKCQEGNPLIPSSQAGQLSVNLGLFAYTATGSYFMKKHQTRVWWLPPAAGIATHTAGLVTGLEHR